MIQIRMMNVLYKHKNTIAAFMLLVLGIFLGVSFYTFNSQDPNWFYNDSTISLTSNFFGTLGANISALLLYFFGISAIAIVVILWYLAYILLRNIPLFSEWERLLSFSLMPFVLSALSNMQSISFVDYIFPGGVIGNGIKVMVMGWFDYTIALVFLYALLFILIFLIFRNSTTYVVTRLFVVFDFIFSKQNFLIPASRIVKTSVYTLMIPFLYAGKFCKNLLCGVDVVGNGRSLDTFEKYMFDNEENSERIKDWAKMDSIHAIVQSKSDDMQNSIHKKDGFTYKKYEICRENEDNVVISKEMLYKLPEQNLFDTQEDAKNDAALMNELEARAKILEEKLERFGVFGRVVSIKLGPVVTLFEYQPQVDTKISKILALEDDLALALKAISIRIIAPIPGRAVVGLEVANSKKQGVLFSSIVKSEEFVEYNGSIPLILGKDTVGNNVIVDLSSMPHLLIAGSTGSGKSVSLNTLLISMLCKLTPDQLNLILVDPKRLEFSAYEDIAHLLFPIITDHKRVSPVLRWIINQMDERYEKMARVGARNVFDYNKKSSKKLSFIVIIIDELADLMMMAGREIEGLIARIAQMARAAGIHMIIATQRPSVDVITGLIKVNFPSRISFRVTSKVDSRTILDCCGAEKLIGRGDMLFLDSASSSLKRLHGAYVSGKEIERVVTHIHGEKKVTYHDLEQYCETEDTSLSDADDQLYKEVMDFLKTIDEVSISLLQRKFRIGYNRSARIIEMLELQGLILPADGGKTRKVIRHD